MPARFEIASSVGAYEVVIDAGLLDEEFARDDSFIITDAFFAERLHAHGRRAALIPAEEHAKSLENLVEVIAGLRSAGLSRDATIVAVGGGVVQDVAGFAASMFMRGVPWIFYPTTLLAMVDSCIGGKSSINVGPYKNIVGAFHPPVSVRVDPTLCGSLSVEQVAAGLVEAAKICFCRGEASFEAYLALAADPLACRQDPAALIELSLRAKTWFVETDEFDRGERLVLNFGHTFGHAIEAASDFAIPHGIAVGLGILAALRLGDALGCGQEPAAARLEQHVRALLAESPTVERYASALSRERLLDAFRADKKHTRESFAVILAAPGGGAERASLARGEAAETKIAEAFAAATGGLWRPEPAVRGGQPGWRERADETAHRGRRGGTAAWK